MATNLQTRAEIEKRLFVTEEMRGDWDYRKLLKDLMPETEYNEPLKEEVLTEEEELV